METVQEKLQSPIGELGITLRGKKIRGVTFCGTGSNGSGDHATRSRSSTGFSFLKKWLSAYFNEKNPSPFPWELLDLDGRSDFEKSVWCELWKIPFGKVESYRSIAGKVGNPGASRAVGQANGRNPIPLLIPCHRVISTDGTLGGFSSGVAIKKKLLSHEGFPGDSFFMSEALKGAVRASERGEIPVGAVMVRNGQVIARASNRREKTGNPLNHAEMLLLRSASKKIGNWRFVGCTLYVTLEPCPMCLGALLQARVDRLVFGCNDPKRTTKSAFPSLSGTPLVEGNNHSMEVSGGVFDQECRQLLREFFKERRAGY